MVSYITGLFGKGGGGAPSLSSSSHDALNPSSSSPTAEPTRAAPPTLKEAAPGSLSNFRAVMARYDPCSRGTLTPEARARLVADYNSRAGGGEVYACLNARYKDGRRGALTEYHLARIEEDLGANLQASRYAAFIGHATQCVRYLAYTSDFGEAFRPLAHPMVVRAAYGVSWGYVIGDVAYKGHQLRTVHKAEGHDLFMGCLERAVFQSFASMIFPMITIHETVRLTKRLFLSRPALHKLAVWGPTFCGLAVVPFLPFMYDAPVEYAVETAFSRVWTPAFAHDYHHHAEEAADVEGGNGGDS